MDALVQLVRRVRAGATDVEARTIDVLQNVAVELLYQSVDLRLGEIPDRAVQNRRKQRINAAGRDMNAVAVHIRRAQITCTEDSSDIRNLDTVTVGVENRYPAGVCTGHETLVVRFQCGAVKLGECFRERVRERDNADRTFLIVEICIEFLLDAERVELRMRDDLNVHTVEAGELITEVLLGYLTAIGTGAQRSGRSRGVEFADLSRNGDQCETFQRDIVTLDGFHDADLFVCLRIQRIASGDHP